MFFLFERDTHYLHVFTGTYKEIIEQQRKLARKTYLSSNLYDFTGLVATNPQRGQTLRMVSGLSASSMLKMSASAALKDTSGSWPPGFSRRKRW